MYNESCTVMDFDKELSDIYPWILRLARKYCFSVQDAEDLAGDTVYKMLANRDRFDSTKSIKPWCLVVMQNTFITQYNRNSLVYFTGYDSAVGKNSDLNPYDCTLLNDILSVIRRCARKSCCVESVIYYAKGYSYDEISRILHIPVGTVRSRISLGRKLLCERMGCNPKGNNLKE